MLYATTATIFPASFMFKGLSRDPRQEQAVWQLLARFAQVLGGQEPGAMAQSYAVSRLL